MAPRPKRSNWILKVGKTRFVEFLCKKIAGLLGADRAVAILVSASFCQEIHTALKQVADFENPIASFRARLTHADLSLF